MAYGGVLLAIPALIQQGLYSAQKVYQPLAKGYYGIVHTLTLLAYMALLRIKNPEQIKNYSPGELGKVMGLDRCPEVKCLRNKIEEFTSQSKAIEWQSQLSKEWIEEGQCVYYFIDGHVRVYSGYKATLQKKFVSRQKLCLEGTTEYWVNDEQGNPFMVFMGELNSKLKDAILNQIVPALLEDTKNIVLQQELDKDPLLARFTLIFDREAYEPLFFKALWDQHRIAIISYRKNIKDTWDDKLFENKEIEVINNKVRADICELGVVIKGHWFREVRRRNTTQHQTSIITTNKKITVEEIAGKMFSRWSQENFFQFMIRHYDFDKMIEYGVDSYDNQSQVVNPEYSALSYIIKANKEKKVRLESKLLKIITTHLEEGKDLKQLMEKQVSINKKIEDYRLIIEENMEKRKATPVKIKIAELPVDKQFNKLKTESKHFMNIIKMIVFRAESSLLNLIKPNYKNAEKDGRQLIADILNTPADIEPDYENKILNVTFLALSTPRTNKILIELCNEMNETKTIYPNSNLTLFFKAVS